MQLYIRSFNIVGRRFSGTAAQAKTATGFYYPNGSILSVQMCGGWLARDGARRLHDGQYYHADSEAPLDGPVYPIADGTVLFRSVSGWGSGNVGIVIRQYTSDGTAFIAVYGHIRTSVVAGNTVRAGISFATIGPWQYGTHVHFGVAPGSTYPSGNLGTLSNSTWPWTNSFVDPLNWILTHTAPAPSTPRLTVSLAGSGSGTVTSSPAGISCSSGSCSKNYTLNTSVTLTATPGSGQSSSAERRLQRHGLGVHRSHERRQVGHRDVRAERSRTVGVHENRPGAGYASVDRGGAHVGAERRRGEL